MKLRSHGAGPSSSKGEEKKQDGESSDEDYREEMTSDPDFNVMSDEALSDEGEDLLNVPEGGRAENNLTGGQCSKVHSNQEEEERVLNTDIDAGIGIDPGNFDLTGIVEEKPERKKRKKRKKKGDTPVLMWEVLEEENDRWIEENLKMDMDLINQNEMETETVEPSDDLTIPLLRYQKEWLSWALKQEESSVKGGILADEMGMGKTLQAIALVLLKRKITRGISCQQSPIISASTSKVLPTINVTLVVCPLIAMRQWETEIERFTSKGSTKLLVYHGSNRAKNFPQFSDYDFVITTYSIVEAEYRNLLPFKKICMYCGKLFAKHKLNSHLKYFCGPGAARTAKQSKQQRKEPKSKKMPNLEVLSKKTGCNGSKNLDSGCKEMEDDSSVENSAVNGLPSAGKSILHSVAWERIILDEAHYIKGRNSNTTRAVLALQSSYRWALSGTPLQNRVGELYSLVRFLQIVPYSYYFCKDCDCHILDYSSSDCPNCPHKNVRHFCWWNKYIASPIQDSGKKTGGARGAMLLLKHKILKSIVLRRTKKGRAADLALPPRIVTLRRDFLDVVELDYYTALYNISQAQFNTYIEAGTVMNNYAHIFDLLTRLRQAVDHPYLVEYSLTSMERKGKVADTERDQKCSSCNDAEEDIMVTSCGHVFCKPCLIDSSVNMGQNLCPSCSKPLTVDFIANKDGTEQSSKTTIKGFRASSILNRIRLDNFQTSTKIDALREEIRFMVEKDGSAKGIVFSQFSSFLDLIHFALLKSGVPCVQLDGSMSVGARDAAIKKFREDPSCRIFLVSLKAGGVALNLTVASHVFLMDPWWNPAVERQAQDRIHRIGQHKPIRIVRFIIENTIEERILKLQEKKELVFEGTVGGSAEALAKLTEDDLKFLFVT